jgi:hypothetical protein
VLGTVAALVVCDRSKQLIGFTHQSTAVGLLIRRYVEQAQLTYNLPLGVIRAGGCAAATLEVCPGGPINDERSSASPGGIEIFLANAALNPDFLAADSL